METYLLNSAACLAILLVFYKLLLEKENMHRFKRFYLLGAVFTSLLIPFITFTTYVEAASESVTIIYENASTPAIPPAEKTINYLPYILWTVYGLGVLFFGFRFWKNLRPLIRKIKQNPKLKKNNAVYVLLQEETAPHTFWDYIFLNKGKFEKHAIPQEVFQHEEAHASQKHSLDILLMEMLQIIFWFNPLLYFTKKAIKLNHEFLADRAVLQKGAVTTRYQETLLSYSSNQPNLKLANPINYSSLKKRFTIMKTKTSKTTIWARTLLLVPLVAALVYSCSQKEIVEKETTYKNASISAMEKATSEMIAEYNKLANSYNIKSGTPLVTVEDHNKMESIYKLMTAEQKRGAEPFPGVVTIEVVEVEPVQKKATPEMVGDYNALAKYYNSQPKDYIRVSFKEYSRMSEIYELMTPEQKKNSEKFPDVLLPPPPPAPATPPKMKSTSTPPPPTYKYQGNSVTADQSHLPPPAPSPPIEAIGFPSPTSPPNPPVPPVPEEGKVSPPPPPVEVIGYPAPAPAPPLPPLEQMKKLAKKGASFYFNGKKVTSTKAIELVKEIDDLQIHISNINSENSVVQLFSKK